MAHLIHWTGTAVKSDFKVEQYPTVIAATAAKDALEKSNLERSGMVANTVSDLDGVGGAFLTGVFNALTGEALKGFHDLATGRKRVWEALAAKTPDTAPAQPEQGGDTTTGQTQEEPLPRAVEALATEEGTTDMATKKATKAKKSSKVKKERSAKPVKAKAPNGAGRTMKASVASKGGEKSKARALEMIGRAKGATVDQIATDLGVSEGSAKNLIWYLRRDGKKIVVDRATGVYSLG